MKLPLQTAAASSSALLIVANLLVGCASPQHDPAVVAIASDSSVMIHASDSTWTTEQLFWRSLLTADSTSASRIPGLASMTTWTTPCACSVAVAYTLQMTCSRSLP